jgi:hypothetical protein
MHGSGIRSTSGTPVFVTAATGVLQLLLLLSKDATFP